MRALLKVILVLDRRLLPHDPVPRHPRLVGLHGLDLGPRRLEHAPLLGAHLLADLLVSFEGRRLERPPADEARLQEVLHEGDRHRRLHDLVQRVRGGSPGTHGGLLQGTERKQQTFYAFYLDQHHVISKSVFPSRH